jgi:multiple sugar transport system substrate-binding protein
MLTSATTNRRTFLAWARALSATVLVAACAQTPAPSPQPTAAPPTAAPTAPAAPAATVAPTKGKVSEVRMAVWGDINDKDAYDAIAKDFNAANSGAHLTGEQWTDDYYAKWQTQIAGGVVPDIVYVQGFSWQPYALRTLLVPLDDYIQRDNFKHPWPTTIQAYPDQTTFRGKTYMTPANSNTFTIFYNKLVFDHFKIPYPKDDWTRQQFRDTVVALTKTDPQDRWYGYLSWGTAGYYQLTTQFREDGFHEWDQLLEPRKATWTTGSILDLVDWELNQTVNVLKCSPVLSGAELYGGGGMSFQGSGRIGMLLSYSGFLPQMQGPKAVRKGGTPFDVAALPRGNASEGTHNIMNIEGQVMMAQSKERDSAWEALKWIAGEKGQVHIAESGRMPNTIDYIRKYWLQQAQDKYNFQNGQAFLLPYEGKQIAESIFAGGVTIDIFTAKVANAFFDKMIAGTSARQLGDEFNRAAQKLLDDFWATQK